MTAGITTSARRVWSTLDQFGHQGNEALGDLNRLGR
jgi:hypothetical protein